MLTATELTAFREKVQAKDGNYEFGKYHQNFVYPKQDQDKIIQVINVTITQQHTIDELRYENEKLKAALKKELKQTHY
jgi:hypothetical protein